MRWRSLEGICVSGISTVFFLNFPRPVTNADYPSLEKLSDIAIKEKQKFERLVLSKEKLLEMFAVRGPKISHPFL